MITQQDRHINEHADITP